MANFIKKKLLELGLLDNEEDDIFEEAEQITKPRETKDTLPTPKRGKIVNIHTTTQLKVVVVQPDTFEDSKEIADHLKTKKPIVVNLESIDRDVAKRIIDFLSGAVYSLDGNIQKISNGIFLIVPYNMGIMGDFKDELRNKVVFPF
jgi:cell division inhibitor SepF